MQSRFVEKGVTIEARQLQALNQFFHSPALLEGGELSVLLSKSKYTLRIAPHKVSLPNGIILYETETREISFLCNGWKTLYYKYANINESDYHLSWLGGTPAELLCVEGVFSQEELNSISVPMRYSTIVAWINPVGDTFEIVRPNNKEYSKFYQNPSDYNENKINAKDIATTPIRLDLTGQALETEKINIYNSNVQGYITFDDREPNIHELVKYDENLGHLRINGIEGASGLNFLQNIYPIVIRIPFSIEKFGSVVIYRKAESGAELQFGIESEDGVLLTPKNGTPYFDSKGNYTLSGTKEAPTVQDYSVFNPCSKLTASECQTKYGGNSFLTDSLKTLRIEPQFFRTVIRPKWERITFTVDDEKTYKKLPEYLVLKITIPPFNSEADQENRGSDGIQWLRLIGFSKYNVPQVRYF